MAGFAHAVSNRPRQSSRQAQGLGHRFDFCSAHRPAHARGVWPPTRTRTSRRERVPQWRSLTAPHSGERRRRLRLFQAQIRRRLRPFPAPLRPFRAQFRSGTGADCACFWAQLRLFRRNCALFSRSWGRVLRPSGRNCVRVLRSLGRNCAQARRRLGRNCALPRRNCDRNCAVQLLVTRAASRATPSYVVLVHRP